MHMKFKKAVGLCTRPTELVLNVMNPLYLFAESNRIALCGYVTLK